MSTLAIGGHRPASAGTKTAAGVVGADGSLRFTDETPTLNRSGPKAILDATERLVFRLRSRAASTGITVSALGIGSAGVINAEQGSVISATDAIAGWAGTQIATTLAARLGLPVRVVNDVHAHAMGEAWPGAAAGVSSTFMVAFGTGVGGSFISRGEPLLGHRFVGGHVSATSLPATPLTKPAGRLNAPVATTVMSSQ